MSKGGQYIKRVVFSGIVLTKILHLLFRFVGLRISSWGGKQDILLK
jgi:hypothetical protein